MHRDGRRAVGHTREPELVLGAVPVGASRAPRERRLDPPSVPPSAEATSIGTRKKNAGEPTRSKRTPRSAALATS